MKKKRIEKWIFKSPQRFNLLKHMALMSYMILGARAEIQIKPF